MAEVIVLLYQEICYRGVCYKSVPLYVRMYVCTYCTCIRMFNLVPLAVAGEVPGKEGDSAPGNNDGQTWIDVGWTHWGREDHHL